MAEIVEDKLESEPNESDSAIFAQRRWRLEIDKLLDNTRFIEMSEDAAHFLHEMLVGQGEPTRRLADLLHGKFLGHPLHPLLTDLTIGSWTLGFMYDLLALIPGTTHLRRTADRLTIMGLLTAMPTALTGIADYAAIKQDATKYGAAHGLLNGIAVLCYSRSAMARLTGNRSRAFFYAMLGFGVIMLSSWLGGDLVYRHRVGVNHVPETQLDEWTAVMPVADLAEGDPVKVEVDDVPVLLFRRDDEVYAINAVCSHAGGPLQDGRVMDEFCIECPWHHSIFDMRDGHVVHSPATFKQTKYAVRIRDEQIEVRNVS